MTILTKFLKQLKNQVVLFTLGRYFSYALQFVKGVLIAKFLGPYFFGIWGFVTLYLQYISFSSLGLQYAVNTELAIIEIEKQKERAAKLINTSIVITFWLLIVLVVVSIIIQVNEIELFTTDQSYQYAIYIFFIGALQHFQQLFSNVYRIYNSLLKVVVTELLVAIVTLSVVFFFESENLLSALLISWILSLIATNVIFLVRAPFKVSISFSIREARELLKIGLPLLFYNVSFYLIMISSRTIISVFYDLEIMGFYSFANNIANAALLGINAIAWIFYPIVINKLKEGTPKEKVKEIVERVTDLYTSAVTLIVFLTILFFPLIYLFLDKYALSGKALNILLLTQIIMATGFAFNTLAIARKKQMVIAMYSFICMMVTTLTGLLFAYLNFDFEWLAVSVFIGYLVFNFLVIKYGLKIVELNFNFMLKVFPWGLQLPIFVFFIGTFFNEYSILFYVFGTLLFLYFRAKQIKSLIQYVREKLSFN